MSSVWAELKRRNVFKVGAAYAIVAWLLIQIADVVLPALGAPDWTISFVTVQLILGFPVALLLAWAYEMTPDGIKSASSVKPEQSVIPATGQKLNYLILGLLALAVAFLVTDQYVFDQGIRASIVGTTRPVTAEIANPVLRPVRRYTIDIGNTESVGNTGLRAHVAVSPDARYIAYSAQGSGETRLYLRALDQLDLRPLPGTEGAYHPFFSPDGEGVGFFSDATDRKLKTVSVQGGPARTLADATISPGAVWGEDDSVIFAGSTSFSGRSLLRVPATGGVPEPVAAPDPGLWPAWPEILPGGDAVLFTMRPAGGQAGDGGIGLLSLETGEYRSLIEGGYHATYAPSGHIVFMRSGTLWAVPFDPDRLESTGPEVPVLEGIESDVSQGGAVYALSDEGLLVYLAGAAVTGAGRIVVRMDREGQEEVVPLGPGTFARPRFSPDGRRLAFLGDVSAGFGVVWIHDLVRGTSSRLTFGARTTHPLWTPDGQRIVFGSTEGLFWKAADGTGQEELIWPTDGASWAESFSPGGEYLVYTQDRPSPDIYLLSMQDELDARPLIQTEFSDDAPRISPDGQWIAYESTETGRPEIYVRPFPNVEDGRWQVSTGGGIEPAWDPQGRELFYRRGDEMMVVTVDGESSFSAGAPNVLLSGLPQMAAAYDISRDDQRLAIVKPNDRTEEESPSTRLIVVENWFEELNRLAPPSE